MFSWPPSSPNEQRGGRNQSLQSFSSATPHGFGQSRDLPSHTSEGLRQDLLLLCDVVTVVVKRLGGEEDDLGARVS
jgi:hypothetical protein